MAWSLYDVYYDVLQTYIKNTLGGKSHKYEGALENVGMVYHDEGYRYESSTKSE